MRDELAFSDPRSSLAGWVSGRVEQWEQHRNQNYELKWDEYYRLWRGIWATEDKTRSSERSKLVAPALQQAIEAAVAELSEATFGVAPMEFVIDPTATSIHDYRPGDQTPEGVDGVVVGLRNKDARNKGKSTAEQVKESKGFAVPHDGEDIVNIPPQFAPKRGSDAATIAGVALPATWFLMQFPHWEDYNHELAAELGGEQ